MSAMFCIVLSYLGRSPAMDRSPFEGINFQSEQEAEPNPRFQSHSPSEDINPVLFFFKIHCLAS
jgi:hypothetical protein